MQFSIRNLYYVVWLQKNHMESLRSGVEPFILCAEFLNVGISKIAVMATLTVNLLHPCNVSPSRSSFPFLSGGPVGGDRLSGLITEVQAERGMSSGVCPLSWQAGVGALLALQRRSSVAFCAELWSAACPGTWVLGMEVLSSRWRDPFPESRASSGTGCWGKTTRNNALLFMHSWNSLTTCRGEWSIPLGYLVLCLSLAVETRAWPLLQVLCVLREVRWERVCVVFSL